MVQVITTHFGLIRLERYLQVLTLTGPSWLGHPECIPPFIACGDFNTSPHSRVYNRIVALLLDVQCALEGWRPQNTWPSRYPLTRIDHIFISLGFTVEEVAVPHNELTRKASDHLPLIATVRLNAVNREGNGL